MSLRQRIRPTRWLVGAWFCAFTLVGLVQPNSAPLSLASALAQSGGDRAVGRAGGPSEVPGRSHNWLVAVGVDVFPDDGGVNPLQYAVADAEAVFMELTRPGGLVPREQAFLLASERGPNAPPAPAGAPADRERYSAKKMEIIEHIASVAEQAPSDGLIIIYVSTHGFVDTKGAAYFMPQDGRLGQQNRLLEDSAVPLKRVDDLLGNSKATKRLLIVDACRNNPAAGGGTRGPAPVMNEAFERALRAAIGQVILSSCKTGQRANEPATSDRPIPDDPVPSPSAHGVYTHYLLQGLRGAAPANADGFISLFTPRADREAADQPVAVTLCSTVSDAIQDRLNELLIQVEGRPSKLVYRLAEIEQAAFRGLEQDGECARNTQASVDCSATRFRLVQENAIGFEFLGQSDGFAFTGVQVERAVHDTRDVNSEPRRRRRHPRTNGRRRSGARKLSHDCWRCDNRTEHRGKDTVFLQENEVVQRRRIGDNDHRPALRSSRKPSQSASKSAKV